MFFQRSIADAVLEDVVGILFFVLDVEDLLICTFVAIVNATIRDNPRATFAGPYISFMIHSKSIMDDCVCSLVRKPYVLSKKLVGLLLLSDNDADDVVDDGTDATCIPNATLSLCAKLSQNTFTILVSFNNRFKLSDIVAGIVLDVFAFVVLLFCGGGGGTVRFRGASMIQ